MKLDLAQLGKAGKCQGSVLGLLCGATCFFPFVVPAENATDWTTLLFHRNSHLRNEHHGGSDLIPPF